MTLTSDMSMNKSCCPQSVPPQQLSLSFSMPTHSFAILEYQYRDASNYKSCGLLLLHGSPAPHAEELIRQHCEAQMYFVAEQVGIPPLYEALYHFSGGPTDDDHVFHEFHGLRFAKNSEVRSLAVCCTVGELAARFRATQAQWDYSLSPHYF